MTPISADHDTNGCPASSRSILPLSLALVDRPPRPPQGSGGGGLHLYRWRWGHLSGSVDPSVPPAPMPPAVRNHLAHELPQRSRFVGAASYATRRGTVILPAAHSVGVGHESFIQVVHLSSPNLICLPIAGACTLVEQKRLVIDC